MDEKLYELCKIKEKVETGEGMPYAIQAEDCGILNLEVTGHQYYLWLNRMVKVL